MPLWWSCIAQRKSGHGDRVVSSWLARRARDAFEESLRKKGFDTTGRPLPGSGNNVNMFGTAQLSVARQALKVSFLELLKQTDIAVSEMQRSPEWAKGMARRQNVSKERKVGRRTGSPVRKAFGKKQ